jgi:hypothetical protein
MRLAIVATTAGYAMTLAAPATAASGGKVPLARSAWFSTSVANQIGAPAGPPVAEPTGVPHGDDAVAFTEDQSGASSKETLLQFSLPSGAASSTVTAFTFSISLDPSSTAPQAGARGAPIVACLPTRAWSSGEGQDSSNQPPVECSHAVAGVWKGDTVTFSIARLAQSWVDDVNLGIALVNNPKNKTQPFQAVFSGGKRVAASLGYEPAATSTTPTPTHHHGPPPHSATHHHSAVPDSGQTSTTPSIPNTSVPTGSSTTTISNGQASGQPPVVAANNGSAAGAKPAQAASQAASRDSSSVPPKGFWAATAGVLILLVGAALALDDHRFVSPTTRRSRLDRLLRDPTRLATFTTRSQP